MFDRSVIQHAKRVVIKIGTRVLVQRSGRPDLSRFQRLVKQIAQLRKSGLEVIVVSSGAVGAGMQVLNMKKRPTSLPDLQMAAAVGQTRLMGMYGELFAKEGCKIGQILLTHDDLNHRTRHLNARNTIRNLLENGVIPIINENDVVSIDEIKFGDNDLLASLAAIMMDVDLLVLLTTVNGYRQKTKSGRSKRVPILCGIDHSTMAHAGGTQSNISIGGMASKLEAAGLSLSTGIPVVIADGRKNGTLTDIMACSDTGTLFLPEKRHPSGDMSHRKRWIAFFHRTRGSLVIDDGAVTAIIEKGKSLLPAGIRQVEGRFDKGSVLNIVDRSGNLIARGLSDYSSENIEKIKGRKTSEIKDILGSRDYDEVIHRDNMVIIYNPLTEKK